MQQTDSENKITAAYNRARDVLSNSYAPYSEFNVSAALVTADGEHIFRGVNVENASLGATICAERSALFTAVTEGYRSFSSIVIVTRDDAPAVPCALCLQVLSEFCEPDFEIHLADRNQIIESGLLKDYLPHPFSKNRLIKRK